MTLPHSSPFLFLFCRSVYAVLVLCIDNDLTSYAEVTSGKYSGGSDQAGRFTELCCEGSSELGEIISAT